MAGLRIRERSRRLGDMAASLALDIFNTGPMKALFGAQYERALARHRPKLPQLTGLDAEIVAGLKRDGIFVTSLAALAVAGSGAMLAAGQELASEFSEEAWRQTRRGVQFTSVPPTAIAARPEIFKWGLESRILDIVEAYIGLPIAYDGLNIIYTVADRRAVATRSWHRDREDRRMLKVAVYCNDVGKGGGAFQLLRRSDCVKHDDQGFHYPPYSGGDMHRMFGAAYKRDVLSCEGPAGTVIFADTAGYFHRGEPAVTQDRAAIFHSYFARSPRHPFFCERSGLSRKQIAALVEEMPPRQRATALWRDAVPAIIRMIPTASL